MALYKRNGTWYLSYRDIDGKWVRETAKTQNKKVALQIYRSRLDELALKKAGLLGEENKVITPDLEEFREDYIDYMKGNKRATNTIELNRYAFKSLLYVVGNKNLREISQRDIERWKKKALETLVDTSVNIYQRSLVSAFNVAVRWEYLKKSPFEDVQLIHAESEKQKPKVYTQEQLQKLYGVVRKDNLSWARLFELYLVSGMRRNELLYLAWEDISWEKREIHICNKPERKFYTKTRSERVIPLSKDIERILREIGVQESGLIFKGERSGNVLNEDFVDKKFRQYRKEAGINNSLTIHNLRHTFATRRVERGAPIEAISKLLGHTTIRTTQKYEHSQAKQYQKDMDRDSLDDILGKEGEREEG